MTTRAAAKKDAAKQVEETAQGVRSMEEVLELIIENEKRRDAQRQEDETRRDRMWQELLQQQRDTPLREVTGRTDARESDSFKGPKMEKLTDSADIEPFLKTFGRNMATHNIPARDWVKHLAPLLIGKARKAYAGVEDDGANDYDVVKEAILQYYDMGAETHLKRFRTMKKKDNESYPEFATRLRDAADKWLAGCLTKENCIDAIAIEQFLQAVPMEMSNWILDQNPTTPLQAGRFAAKFCNRRGFDSNPFRSRGECQNNGGRHHSRYHNSRDAEQKNSRPGNYRDRDQRGGNSKNSTQEGDRTHKPTEKGSGPRCYNCNNYGHLARDCASKQRVNLVVSQDQTPRIWQGELEGLDASNIRADTGADKTVVHSKYIPRDAYLGSKQLFQAFSGENHLLPLATVNIKLGDDYYFREVAVHDDLKYDALLGKDIIDESSIKLQAGDILAVTRSQAAHQQAVEEEAQRQEAESEVSPTTLLSDSEEEVGSIPDVSDIGLEDIEEEEARFDFPFDFDSSLFVQVPPAAGRSRMTRRQKRLQAQERTLDPTGDSPEVSTLSHDGLSIQQKSDPTLASQVAKADRGEMPFFWREGILYKQASSRDPSDPDKIVVPSPYRNRILRMAHFAPLSGHFGVKKTLSRISNRFHWPKLREDVVQLCRCCPECQKAATPQRNRAPLVPLPIIGAPFERIAMDIVGPLRKTKSGKRFLLVVMDYCTRWPEVVPLRHVDSVSVADALLDIFARTGFPKEILTDQGSNFTSLVMKEFYKTSTAQHIRTSAYHPQTDGLVERFNGTLKQMLKKTVHTKDEQWDQLLPFILFAYRSAKQETTGYSPFELMYGHKMRTPLEALADEWDGEETVTPVAPFEYIQKVQERLRLVRGLAQGNEKQAKSTQKKWYDRTATTREFCVGDPVLVYLPEGHGKLDCMWQGPFYITRKVTECTYEIEMPNRRKPRRIFHVNGLKLWHSPSAALMLCSEGEKLETVEEEDDPTWSALSQDVPPDPAPTTSHQLNPQQEADLARLKQKYRSTFTDTPGKTNAIHHRIETGAAHPVFVPPYRVPQALQPVLREQIKEMLEQGIIEPSKSEWASPVLLVPKKDGTKRLCVDYRKLNAVTTPDPFRIPRIDEVIDRLGKAKYLSTLDLTKGYWQVPVAEEHRHKTAFMTPEGKYQFRTMPFGLSGAPSTFQRMMNILLKDFHSLAAAYIDDIVVFSDTWEDHLKHLDAILHTLQEANLTVKESKCRLARRDCIYLGHVVGQGFVKPDDVKTHAIRNFLKPRSKKDVRSFLGLAGYYRRFVPNFATIAAPLSDLTSKGAPNRVMWEQKHQFAFDQLKRALSTTPVLKAPNFDRTFILQSDASDVGLGAVLSQRGEDGQEHPLAFYSRKLLPRERKYLTVEKECLPPCLLQSQAVAKREKVLDSRERMPTPLPSTVASCCQEREST